MNISIAPLLRLCYIRLSPEEKKIANEKIPWIDTTVILSTNSNKYVNTVVAWQTPKKDNVICTSIEGSFTKIKCDYVSHGGWVEKIPMQKWCDMAAGRIPYTRWRQPKW